VVSTQSPLPPYDERGSGPAVVFSHGTLMDRTMFAPQVEALADAYRVVCFDSRARAGSAERSHDLRDLVADCVRLLDGLGIERCVLAGMSVGGFMALELALAHPERLDGLILIDAMAQAYTPEEQAAYGEEFGKLDADGPVPREWAEWAAPYCFGETTARENPQLIEEWIDRWCRLPARSVYREGFSWLHKDDLSGRVATITVPTLALHGVEDVPIPLERGRAMVAAMPNARLVEVPGAGHTSNLENPPIVNRAIRDFLDQIYGR
jgi:pimeloyl-ACP methyl ester carboxylesterase